jgi:hypothetical protein
VLRDLARVITQACIETREGLGMQAPVGVHRLAHSRDTRFVMHHPREPALLDVSDQQE